MNKERRVQVIALVKPTLKESLQKEADRRGMSLSHLCRNILTMYDSQQPTRGQK